MNLRDAALCLDCEEIVLWNTGACPKCGLTAIVTMAGWLPSLYRYVPPARSSA